MTKAFYSGFYPDGQGVGGTALGSASHRGVEDIIKNLDDISIQRLVEARAHLNLKIGELNQAIEGMETVINVTIPDRIAVAEQAITTNRNYAQSQLNNAVQNFNNKISLVSPEAGSIGERVLAYQSTLNGHALRLSGIETIVGTDDGQGTLMGRIASLEEVTTDGSLVTSSQFNNLVSSISQYSKVYAQNDAPTTGMTAGDVWIDLNDNNKMYRYNGTSWINVTPAGSSMRTFAQPEPPTTGAAEDLWFDTNDNNKMYRHNGTTWVLVEDLRFNSITSSINSLNQTVADLEESKASASTVAGIQAEIADARGSANNLNAKLTTMSNALVDGLAGKADASRVSALESTINTAGTGLTAKVGALETATADLQSGKADASRVSQLEVNSVRGSMGGSLTRSELFTAASPAQSTSASLTAGTVVTPADGGGPVRELVNTLVRVTTKGWIPVEDGRTYRVISRVRLTSVGPAASRVTVGFALYNGSSVSVGYATSPFVALSVADGWVVKEYTHTAEELRAIAGDVTWIRGFVRGPTNASGANANSTIQIDVLEFEDYSDFQAQNAKITLVEQATTDLQNGKADASRVSALESTINTAGTGLAAKVSSLENATTNLQNGKADASALSSVSAKVDNLDNSRKYSSIGGSPGQTPEAFTSNLTGSPATVPDLNMASASIETDTDEGKVLRVSGVARHIWSKGWVPLTPGETHRITAKVRVVTDGGNANRTQVGVRLSNEAGVNAGQAAGSYTHTAADGWKVYTFERTTEQLLAAAAAGTTPTHFRVGAYAGNHVSTTGASGAVVDVAWVRYENITEIKSVGASVSNLSSAVSDLQNGKADASRVSALEATVNTPSTGLSAKVSGLETATANLQSGKADASRVSEIEASMVSRPNILPNGGLENGITGMVGAGPSATLGHVVDRDWGPAVKHLGTASGTYSIRWPQFDVREGQTYTISGDTGYFHAGGNSGNSYLDIMFLNANGDIVLDGPQKAIGGQHDFSNDPSRLQAHAVSAVAPTGAVKAYARAVFTSMVNPTFMGVRRVKVEQGGLPASVFSDETSSYSSNARIANAESAIVDLNNNKASATSVSELEASLVTYPNLILNSDFTQGAQDWVFTGVWTVHYDPAYGGMAMALGGSADYHYLYQDVPCHQHATYTLSWTGDGGASPEKLNIYVECKNSAGVTLSSAGNVKMTGVYWESRKSFSFTTPANTAYVRVIAQKNATSGQFNCFISRFMLNTGPTAKRWNNDAGIKGLGARITTVSNAVTNLQTGKADASRVTNLEADLNTAGSGIKARLTVTEAVAVQANGKAQSTYGVVADANGSIVGFQMTAGGNSSSFKIRADKFEVASASSSGARTVYSGNSWKVYDNNNVLRVEMGVF